MRLPIKMPNLPPGRDSVARLVSADNLRSVAAATNDPQVLLGLAVLAGAGDPVRKELADLAVCARADYVPVAAILTVMLDRVDSESASEVVKRDPENALGHYLTGTMLHVANNEPEALAAFHKAAACLELRLYDSMVGEALFKALDALNARDLDRLCASSWATSRWTDFSSAAIQPMYNALSEIARANSGARAEVAEILLTLAGHLFSTNFTNRWFAQRAIEAAFSLKAQLAGENSAKRNAYAAAVYGLTTPLLSYPALKEWSDRSPLQLAQFLPGRIWTAFSGNAQLVTGDEKYLNDSDRASFGAAKERAGQTARNLIDAALIDQDGILAAYFKEVPRTQPQPAGGRLFAWTAVEGLLPRRPELVRAAAANEEAMGELWNAAQNSPSRKNLGRLMEIGRAIQGYAQSHDRSYPESLAVLFETGRLKPPLEPKSLLTGRPYVYVAAGERDSGKMNERIGFVLIYDDEPDEHGWHPCAFALVSGGNIPARTLAEHLRKRGKSLG
jgi:hypothetical protein